MGFFRNCLSYCCAACMLFVMAGVSFTFFDLGNAISGSLFVNLGSGLQSLFQLLTGNDQAGTLITVLLGGFMGLFSVVIFPIHWLLYYRPDEPMMAIALLVPWVLSISISALLFAKSARQGIFIGVYLASGVIVTGVGAYLIITIFLSSATGTEIGSGVINGMFQGLTGLHPIFAIILTALEGAFIGGVFGAFIGSLKYKAEEDKYQPKKRKKKEKSTKDDSDSGFDGNFPYEVGEY